MSRFNPGRIHELRGILLRGLDHLHDRGSIIGVHLQHLGSHRELESPRLGADHGGCER